MNPNLKGFEAEFNAMYNRSAPEKEEQIQRKAVRKPVVTHRA